jgi:ComF family protein
MAIVRNILDILFPPRAHEVLVRRCTHEELLALMHPARIGTETIALLPYRNPLVQALIIEAKFHNNSRAQELLGQVLKDYLFSLDLENSVLVPVPLSSKRYRERGYNQAERIGSYAGRSINPELLTRTRDTLPQTTLGGSLRRTNILGAFAATEQLNSHTTYIVLDDVSTTGATLREAMQALTEGGAGTIIALALAH